MNEVASPAGTAPDIHQAPKKNTMAENGIHPAYESRAVTLFAAKRDHRHNADRRLSFSSVVELRMYIEANGVELIDMCFSDPLGLWHHCTFHESQITPMAFKSGFPFDGSSIRLFAGVAMSDLVMVPDLSSCWMDPFSAVNMLHLTCDILYPTGEICLRCPRSIAKRCEQFIVKSGIADQVFVGFEAEFYIFDDVRYCCKGHKVAFEVDSKEEASWNTDASSGRSGGRNLGHRVSSTRGYFPVPPIDKHAQLRSKMLLTMGKIGLPIEKHHHEVGSCQHELGIRYSTIADSADMMMAYKYVVKNVAHQDGLTATFMPKPMYKESGSGMHCHLSLWKGKRNLFYDATQPYEQLSQTALFFIGGILKHAPAIFAFTNSTTNSYKRLGRGFEAPSCRCYSRGNRSAGIRIPICRGNDEGGKRIEFRCSDPGGSPYLAFAAIVMAGLDGIMEKIMPPEPLDEEVKEPPEDQKSYRLPRNLTEALEALEEDQDFLLKDGVFDVDFIEAYITLKKAEVTEVMATPHPKEYDLYYNC